MSRTLFYLRFIAQCFPTKWDFISLLVTSIDDETCSLNETANTTPIELGQFSILIFVVKVRNVHCPRCVCQFETRQIFYRMKANILWCVCVWGSLCNGYMHVAKVFDCEWMTSIMLLKLMENLVASTARFTIKEWMHACEYEWHQHINNRWSINVCLENRILELANQDAKVNSNWSTIIAQSIRRIDGLRSLVANPKLGINSLTICIPISLAYAAKARQVRALFK